MIYLVLLNIFQNLVQYRIKNMLQKESLRSVICYIQYILRTTKDVINFTSSGTKMIKRVRRRQYDPLIIEKEQDKSADVK